MKIEIGHMAIVQTDPLGGRDPYSASKAVLNCYLISDLVCGHSPHQTPRSYHNC